MAAVEPAARPHDRHSRRRPFTSWMKRLANFTGSSSEPAHTTGKKGHVPALSWSKKSAMKNNPYPQSGHLHGPPAASSANGHLSFSTPVSQANGSYTSFGEEGGPHNAPLKSNKSAAPTLATNAETISSDTGQSKTGTSHTAGGGVSSHDGGENSTFSSPNQSEHSLTTTLTTIQSAAPSGLLSTQNAGTAYYNQPHAQQTPIHFSHQYPTSPQPASAIPAHLAPQPNPHTYTAATANNILTDNASILTLASSSKRRRRRSLDTDASVRALAPSSLFGNSRESLPLSVLSGNAEAGSGPPAGTYQSQTHSRPSIGGFASAERASVYSSSGVAAPALSSERNSYYAAKQGMDGLSVRSGRSGLLGHGRTESITNSIGGTGIAGQSSPLASPREGTMPGRTLSRSSDPKGTRGEGSDGEDEKRSMKDAAVRV